MLKNAPSFFALLVAAALGGWLTYQYFVARPQGVENASVLLEKIETVAKLTTVEGQFSEVYNYSEYEGYFTFLWDKKVLVRVRATVAAGYDLEQLNLVADPVTKTVRMSALPEPKILSIDHTLDYYDISQGIFESFSPEDHNRINKRAKDLIREQAEKSNLLPAAQEQAEKMIELVRFMVESAGWKLEVEGRSPLG
ncbi:MAG: DUF4230 domain-containing protein [Lewinellaceae bacterium]|nr:DUF4230 domain-containing protein [Lewinellaceae bacterium]